MKYILFAGVIIFGIPIGAMLFRTSEKYARILFAIMCLVPAINITIKFMAHDFYHGDYRGYEVNLAEIVALMMLLGMSFSNKYQKLIFFPKHSLSYILVMLIGGASLFGAWEPLYGSFTLFRFFMVYIIFITAYNYVRQSEKNLRYAIFVFALALAIQVFDVVKEKYLGGSYRVQGTFWHPNTLSMYIEILVPIVMAVILSEKLKYSWFYWTAVLGSIFAVLATFSRGGIAVLGAQIMMLVFFSLVQKITARKTIALSIMVLLLLAGGIKASGRIIERFEQAPESSGHTRVEFNNAASAMAGDYALGVGLNNFSYGCNNKYYSKFFSQEPGGHGVCHNIYWLTIAETGWTGFAIFMFFLLGLLFRALLLTFRSPKNIYTTVGLGIFVAFSGVYFHGLLEWIFRQLPIQYLFFTVIGVLIAADELHVVEKLKRKQLLARQRKQ